MKILVKGKVETVSLDRVKPAHMECEPTTGTTTQRKPPSKLCLVIRGYIFYNPATCTKQSPTRQFGPTLSLTRG